MKRVLAILIFFSFNHFSFSQISWHISLLSHWDNDSLPAIGEQQFNEVASWHQPSNNKEYAILGGLDSIYFFDVSDATLPQLLFAKPGASKKCINRDFAVYQKYLYTTADEGKATLQVYDLSFLPDSVSLVFSHDSLSQNCHTIYNYKDKLFLAKNKRGNQNYALDIIDISDPVRPHLISSLVAPRDGNGQPMFDMVHDVTIADDTLYCFCGNGGLYIYDISNIYKPKYLNSLTQYPGQGYCHSGIKYKEHLFFTDENNGKEVKNYKVQNVYNPLYINSFGSHPNAIPHNLYIKGKQLWLSSYQDGVTVWSIDNLDNPVLAGYYDTYPQNSLGDYKGLIGCWAIDCNLPSGVILASDMANGLFVLQADKNLSISLAYFDDNCPLDIYTIDGKIIYKNIYKKDILNTQLQVGLYVLRQDNYTEKYIIVK